MMWRPAIHAKWKKLLFSNYEVDPALLKQHIPFQTELALWNDRCYVSLVGFLFLDTKLGPVPIPLHTNFPEINLRFYVRRKFQNEWRYGVVFLKEIVGLPMVAFVANTFFNEHYEVLRLKDNIRQSETGISVEYRWKKKEWHAFSINCYPGLIPIAENSPEHFFTAQHWGYTKIKDDRTREYSVAHPKWQMYRTSNYSIEIGFEEVFGNQFSFLKNTAPASVFLAEGSEIILEQESTLRSG